MNVFVSWSGGKDCMLALHRIIKEKKHNVVALVNMCTVDGEHSGSHGLSKSTIHQQAIELGIPIIQQPVDKNGYEHNFKQVISNLKEQGVQGAVFGDIYLEAHHEWITRVCDEIKISPIFPLWLNNTNDLLNEFIDAGFETLAVSVNSKHLSKVWLGRILNQEFLKDICLLDGIDACAENGEYHTFVYNGPLFKKPVHFTTSEPQFENNHWVLPLTLKDNV